VRFKALDGSCVIGKPVPLERAPNPDALAVRVWVDGALAHRTDTGQRIRPLAQLLADVTDFMTLAPGDILLLGTSHGATNVRAGQRVVIEIDGLGRLEHTLVAAGAPHDHPMEPHA
jgi:5-oxopent-3-ene-1,2,5-tricarboxylate decarboxylase/2-hydroxyhepta-2,4-diene-1,7-dioate isomerase